MAAHAHDMDTAEVCFLLSFNILRLTDWLVWTDWWLAAHWAIFHGSSSAAVPPHETDGFTAAKNSELCPPSD